MQVMGFDWKNCGKPDAPAVLKSLSVSPDPISIPGDLKASASGSTSVELSAPLSVSTLVVRQPERSHRHGVCDTLQRQPYPTVAQLCG